MQQVSEEKKTKDWTIEEIKTAIGNWKELIDDYHKEPSDKILNYLNSGSSFQITKQEYEGHWNKLNVEKDSVHCYVGVENRKLYFFLIDSISDKEEKFEDNIIVKEYLLSTGGVIGDASDSENLTNDRQVSATDAIERRERWINNSNVWLEQTTEDIKDNPIFQAIDIPLANYKDILFENSEKITYSFLALKKTGGEKYNYTIEIIVGSSKPENINTKNFYYNLTRPIPPFKGEKNNYNLI